MREVKEAKLNKKKKEMVEKDKIFVTCKRCNRPYKKGVNYPDEVCPACESADKL